MSNEKFKYKYGFVDVSLLINRIYHAQGEDATVEKVLKAGLKAFKRNNLEQKVETTFYCFDAPNNRRKIIYPEYKANRPPKSPILEEVFDILYDFFNNGLGLRSLKVDGFEADDLIASLKVLLEGDYKTVIFSADKDLLKLLDDNCVMMVGVGADKYKTTTKEDVRNKYKINPEDISTYLALMGDKADNFPGILGCGDKTAVKLINEFGDYNSIIENVHNIKSKTIKSNILKMDDMYLPKKLADLVDDVEIKFTSSKNKEIKDYYMSKYNLDYAVKRSNTNRPKMM
jgi:5'-3' exonuclease